jgi:hypothetical protein
MNQSNWPNSRSVCKVQGVHAVPTDTLLCTAYAEQFNCIDSAELFLLLKKENILYRFSFLFYFDLVVILNWVRYWKTYLNLAYKYLIRSKVNSPPETFGDKTNMNSSDNLELPTRTDRNSISSDRQQTDDSPPTNGHGSSNSKAREIKKRNRVPVSCNECRRRKLRSPLPTHDGWLL